MRRSLVLALGLLACTSAWAEKVDLDYHVRLLPESGQAEVRLTLADGAVVRSLDFDLGKGSDYSDFKSDGQWLLKEQGQRGFWQPGPGKTSLSYRVKLDQRQPGGTYETRITPQWALFRGDQLVPPARLDQQDGTELVSRLSFELPAGWKSVETPWPRIGKQRFRIDNVSRLFDRPTGWMLAGTSGSRRARLGDTQVTVAAPQGQGMHRMDTLTLLTFIWPQLQAVFPRNPSKLLLVGARDEMWRGARSAYHSIYLHSSRPLISENGTSALLRELVHQFAQIHDRDDSDWLSESLADYYATVLLYRSGGMSEDRYRALQARLHRQGAKVTHLRGEQASAQQIARGVLLLQALDREIRLHNQEKRSLDDVTRALMRLQSVSTDDFVQISENVLGRRSEVLDSKLLR
uniref:M1 family metallopeptidase n=1 Tax=Pseudomonas fluorescens TaxID=294 RepID=UPI00130E8A95|nr:M1 family metallopeptidase [Pseudomonas fluorescens]